MSILLVVGVAATVAGVIYYVKYRKSAVSLAKQAEAKVKAEAVSVEKEVKAKL